MAILEEDVARVRQAADLVEIAQEHIALRKVGRRWAGLCPFHAEKSPSFSVNGEEGLYYCFGCQAKGDVISFVREVEHLDFVAAIEKLAGKTGIQLRYDDSPAAAHERKRKAALSAAMQQATEWYHQRLLSSPDARAARSYLRDRGYDGEIVRRFKIGWAPDAWDELSKALRLPTDVLTATGLGYMGKRGRPVDAFRKRVLFPIFDSSGAPVAFGGRAMPQGDPPKYKNSSETPLYSKSRTLYALNWAKTGIVERDEVVVCEGYTDVIGFFQAGVPRAVATCGTALTEEHVRMLKNFASRVVLAYDADGAGQAAADRFYEWERKIGIDIVVAALPAGMDPADAARRDPGALKQSVEEAKPYLAFRLERLLAASDLRTVEGRARAAERCCAMIAEHPNDLVRDQYLMMVSDRCRVPIERLRAGVHAPEVRTAPVVDLRPNRRNRERRQDSPPQLEMEALRVAVLQPEGVIRTLNAILPENGSECLEEILFADPRSQSAFRSLINSATLHEAIADADPEASELLSRLAVEEEAGDAQDEILRLVDRAASRAVRELEVEARASADGYARCGPALAWLKLTIEQLRDAASAVEAGAAIIAWLSERNSLVKAADG